MTAPIPHSLMRLPEWAIPLGEEKHRYKVLYGGRGSGKTWAVAGSLAYMGHREPLRIACVREHQKSIQESAKKTIENWIKRMGYDRGEHRYTISRDFIKHTNGTHFFFRGMSTASEEDIRGWESVDICWVEEAHRMTESSWEILFPTIRKPGSELWFTFNPQDRADPVYKHFVTRRREGAWLQKVNYCDNPWFPAELEEERKLTERWEPDRYPHIWLGEPDDAGATRKVLPFATLEACVKAHAKGLAPNANGFIQEAGLDVADRGLDRNALAHRAGPVVVHIERWSAAHQGETFQRFHNYCHDNGIQRAYFDAGGLGTGMQNYFREHADRRNYQVRSVMFGSAVRGKKRNFTPRVTNEMKFGRYAGQLGFAVRLRAMKTERLLAGDGVNPGDCLFINHRMPLLESVLAELSRPEWSDTGVTGKVEIDKAPDDEASPDRYDALVLAFGKDSEGGLRSI